MLKCFKIELFALNFKVQYYFITMYFAHFQIRMIVYFQNW